MVTPLGVRASGFLGARRRLTVPCAPRSVIALPATSVERFWQEAVERRWQAPSEQGADNAGSGSDPGCLHEWQDDALVDVDASERCHGDRAEGGGSESADHGRLSLPVIFNTGVLPLIEGRVKHGRCARRREATRDPLGGDVVSLSGYQPEGRLRGSGPLSAGNFEPGWRLRSTDPGPVLVHWSKPKIHNGG